MNVKLRKAVTAHCGLKWPIVMKNGPEFKTVIEQEAVENSRLTESVTEVVGATSSDGFPAN